MTAYFDYIAEAATRQTLVRLKTELSNLTLAVNRLQATRDRLVDTLNEKLSEVAVICEAIDGFKAKYGPKAGGGA